MRSDGWRSNIDCLLITVATNACKVGWADNNSTVVYGEATPIWADFQLAALRTLLASLLSPGRVRPPHLAQGLELFRRGSRESGTKISEYCCHALLTLEVLIHPRALPFIDIQSAIDHYGSASLNLSDVHFADHSKNTSFHFSTLGKEPSQPESGDDNLYERWLANGDEIDVNDLGKYTSSDKESSGTSTHPAFEKLPRGDSPSERNEHEGGDLGHQSVPSVNELLVGGRWGSFREETMSFNGRDNVREVRKVSDGCFSSGMYSLRSDRNS